VWEAGTGRQRGSLKANDGGGSHAAISPDGKLLAVAGNDTRVRLWDWAAGKEARQLPRHADSVYTVAFSPDGTTLASAAGFSVIHLRDAHTGRPRFPPQGHEESVSSVACSPDGRLLATAGFDGQVLLWDARTARELHRLPAGGGEWKDVAFRPGNLSVVTIAPDGKHVAAARGDEVVLLWDVRTGKETGRFPGGRVAFSPDGKWVACAGRAQAVSENRGVVRLYDRATGKKVRELWGHLTPIAWLRFADDSATIVSAGLGSWSDTAAQEKAFVRVWDVSTGQEQRGLPAEATRAKAYLGFSSEQTQVLALSPDSRTWASVTRKWNTIKLGEVATGGWRVDLAGHTEYIYAATFSPDGRLLASASMDGTVRLWELPSGKEIARLEGHRGSAFAATFSPDGRKLVTGGADATALVWDLAKYLDRRR
jgi:WD40 repeat protein